MDRFIVTVTPFNGFDYPRSFMGLTCDPAEVISKVKFYRERDYETGFDKVKPDWSQIKIEVIEATDEVWERGITYLLGDEDETDG